MIIYINDQYSSTTSPYEQMNIIELSLLRGDLWDQGVSWEETLKISKKKLLKLYKNLDYVPYIQNKINMWYETLSLDYENMISRVDYSNWEYKINKSKELGIYNGIDCRIIDILTLIRLRRIPTIWNIIFGY